MIKIRLTAPEILQGAFVGIMRQCQNIQKGAKQRYGAEAMPAWQMAIEGALGEMAVAKALDTFWSGRVGDWKAADVGQLQVRTARDDSHCLIVHPSDNDQDMFILVTGTNGKYTLRGAKRGLEAKDQRYWRDPVGGRPAFFVPQSDLEELSQVA